MGDFRLARRLLVKEHQSENMRYEPVVALVMSAAACSGHPSAIGPSNVRTRTMVGTVTESIPTASTTVSAATITVMNGPDAGRSTTSDANGAFAMMVLPGELTVRVQAPNYQERLVPVSLTTQNRNVKVEIDPVPQMVTMIRANEIVVSDQTCPDYYAFFPPTRSDNCKVNYVINVHHDGTLTADLTSGDELAGLFHLAVFQSSAGQPIGPPLPSEPYWREATSGRLRVEMPSRAQYVLQVSVLAPSLGAISFDLRLSHPN
jgi:hypothetical protein